MKRNPRQLILLDGSFKNNSILDFSAIGSVRDFRVLPCKRKEIAAFISHWHYSGSVNGITADYNFKLTDESGKIIGAMMYGSMAMADIWKKYAHRKEDLIELRRLCCIDNTPKNTESYFIGKTIQWIKKNTNVKKIISYADTTHNHEGIIYKATNFKHIGMTAKGRIIMFKGKKFHDKAIRTKNSYDDNLRPFAKELKEALKTGEACYVETKPKHIYIYEL